MSERAYALIANLRWFAVVDFLVRAAVIALAAVVLFLGIEPPRVGAWFDLALFAGVGAGAGVQFAKRRPDWTCRDRHYLALGYVAASLTVDVALMAIQHAFGSNVLSDLLYLLLNGRYVFGASGVGPIIFIATFAVASLLQYAVSRLLLNWIRLRAARVR